MGLPEEVPVPGEVDGESKRDRFVRIAEKRTQTIMERLRVLGNCANRAVYSYTEADVEKIFGALAQELQDTRRKFERTKTRRDFKL